VISLERSGRWPQEAMLQRLGIAEAWPAVDGAATPLAELEQRWVVAGVLRMDRPTRYKQGALGLIASSWQLWQHALEQGHA
jgi:hypothetical protein